MLKRKPAIKFIGTEGTMLSLIAKAYIALQKVDQHEEARQMTNESLQAHNIEEALQIVSCYVEIR